MSETHDSGIDKLNHMRFLGALTALVRLFEEFDHEKWAAWFAEVLKDYQEAYDTPGSHNRQLAIVEHVFMAFTGLSDFTQEKFSGKDPAALQEAQEKLIKFSKQLWASARGIQAHILKAHVD
ncbi:MAG: hypothetical protein OEY93_07400 [Anaerolineae bacterium]|nr:hypothetical protein [Anaerolineae bacterium]